MKVEQVGIHAMKDLLDIYPKAVETWYGQYFDQEALEENFKELYDFWTLKERFGQPQNLYFLLYENDQVLGLMRLILEGPSLKIQELFLYEESPRYLQALYDKFLEIAQAWEKTSLQARFLNHQTQLIDFFQAKGFQPSHQKQSLFNQELGLTILTL